MKYLKRILSFIVIVLIFFFLIRTLVLNWENIPFNELHFNGWYIALSLLMLVLHFLSYSKSWQEIMIALGHDIKFTQSLWIIATTQIAKYLPGRIWYMIGRVYIGKKENFDSNLLAVSMILEICLLIITSGILFLIATLFSGMLQATYIILGILLIIVAATVIHPRILSRLVSLIVRLLHRKPVTISMSYVQMVRVSIFFFGLWLAQIIGFYFLILAIYPADFSMLPTLMAAYTLSWITGFVVLFAPSGLGVREGVMTLLLSSILTTPLAIAMSFLSRIWFTFFEIVVFFVGLLVRRAGRRSTQLPAADRLD
ncbi:flippase-like domain-containing protein [candidate division WOR-3 bacterium]|nr:flippase-like domain-containing protein [candidate division WOR-3 bacterium]